MLGEGITIFSEEVSQIRIFAGWRPYVSFEELESCTNAQAVIAEDVPKTQAMETQNESRLDERSGIGCISPTAGRSLADMESGGR